MNLKTHLNRILREGNLAYEYNPFHNYLTDVDLYEVETDVGKVLVPKGKAVNTKNGRILTKIGNNWVDNFGNVVGTYHKKTIDEWEPPLPTGTSLNNDITEYYSGPVIYELTKKYATKGSLIDFTTDQLNFDLQHPVDITIQPSYDGSVNLILNDGKNIPRLINSRFSAREKNTYEIVDRIGENDTNIYNSKDFDKDTSLYFRYSRSPKVRFVGHTRGTLKVGQYCYYFTYCDADDNESDIIAESGLIPTFIGGDRDPFSIDGGIKNQDSNKGICIELRNLDKSYNYIKIYQLRYFADYLQNRVYECKKIYHKYSINTSYIYINISGNEDGEMIDANILNLSLFNPNSVLALAQCKNMLFFGNIVKNIDNYKELQDCALRIYPTICTKSINDITSNYTSNDDSFAYYDVANMYNNVGYFSEEYYRFGVVFMYSNGTLSNVYNTLGYNCTSLEGSGISYNNNKIYSIKDNILERNYIVVDDEGWISSDVYTSDGIYNLNSKGVLRINLVTSNNNNILYIKFKVHNEVIEHLQKLGIVGMFFVRQKRVPNIIALCYILPIDKTLQAPVIKLGDNYICERFINSDRELTQEYSQRLITKTIKGVTGNIISSNAYAGICPDFLLNLPYYNQIFNGGRFRMQQITKDSTLSNNERNYIHNINTYGNSYIKDNVKICTVTEDVPTVAIEKQIYRLNIGEAEEAYRFRYVFEDLSSLTDDKQINLVRGTYSPYLAIYSETPLLAGELYNIYYEKEYDIKQEFLDRMNSREPFYAICDRYNFEDLDEIDSYYTISCYRGDCYNNTFTYRLNRNFNDPTLPNNDELIKGNSNTFKDNYKKDDPTKWTDISRSDVNAIKLGSWITIKVKSYMNYALRSNDGSYVSETALMGSDRSFFPRSALKELGENKKPDSYLYNDAYRATLGFKCYFALNDVNYIKNVFSNRILYSAISIQDSYKNNFRYSLSTYFRDYSQEYGSIQKLVGFEGYLLVVFEHAVCIAVINERVLAGQSDGEPVFINTNNVLPEELTVISDTYGTQWPESVVKSEAGYVYGVDTIQKKIWRVKGQQIEIISDFKVNSFLVNNITLGERETYPIIGLRNVKTHYNNNKKDIMFTFYDDVYKDEEKVWNLCYNELLEEFVTFYSWVPSYSENIDTQFFSFDRNSSKYLSLLNKCNYNIPENNGILLDSPVVEINIDDNPSVTHLSGQVQEVITTTIKYRKPKLGYITKTEDGILYNEESKILEEAVEYIIEKDHWNNYKYAKITEYNGNSATLEIRGKLIPLNATSEDMSLSNFFLENKVMLLELTPFYKNSNNEIIYYSTETIAIYAKSLLELGKDNELTTDFYLHGMSGIVDSQEQLYPTYWYGEFHPFEFEFVVNDKVALLKIFTDLMIISNKAEPESFHFEIEGDNYEFSSDKRNMYFRQEATKNLFLNLGSDMLYDRKFTDVGATNYTFELYYRALNDNYMTNGRYGFDKVYPKSEHLLVQQKKSTIFPLYYERVDTYNLIYYDYKEMLGGNTYDFKNLSGSEILWNRRRNLFNIVTHIKNSPIDLVGRIRGNSRYKEGVWRILIPSILFSLCNEGKWPENYDSNITINGNNTTVKTEIEKNGSPLKYLQHPDNNVGGVRLPPIVINSLQLPKDLQSTNISLDKLPNIYIPTSSKDYEYLHKIVNIQQGSKWTQRKETKIRDKWMKVRIRYSGHNLAIIHSIVTLYNLSYS